jgi:DNA-binding NtrC family response regulator
MLLGESDTMQTIHTTIHRLSNDDSISVLITGETGVGKELVAQAIHHGGLRASKPFVPVNCGAIPATLSETLFFGHIQGAFTGAAEDHKGYFETANGGTLFLDEVGEMSPENQATLLRVLDDGVIMPVGATEGKKVDVRVISATNVGLLAKADAELFRSDLYQRLTGMIIPIPPLRDRTEDILPIAEYYLSEVATRIGLPLPSLSPEAVAALETYSFPGNVRELINIIQSAVIVSQGTAIQPKHLRFEPPSIDVSSSPVTGIDEESPLNTTDSVPHPDDETGMSEPPFLPLNEALARYERQYLYQVLDWTGGNKAAAARLLDVPQRTFYRKLAKYNL